MGITNKEELDCDFLIEMIKLGAIFHDDSKFLKLYDGKAWCSWKSNHEEKSHPMWACKYNITLQEFLLDALSGALELAEPDSCPTFDRYDYLEHIKMGSVFCDADHDSQKRWYKYHNGNVYFCEEATEQDEQDEQDDGYFYCFGSKYIKWDRFSLGVSVMISFFESGTLFIDNEFPPIFNDTVVKQG